jgi:hypothetical protein
MRKTLAAIAAAGALALGIVAAGPAAAGSKVPLSLAGSNCTVVNGVCVFPGAIRGERYEAFIVTNDGTTDTFTVVAGSLPPGISLTGNGTQGAILIGTPTQDGTFIFTVHVVNPKRQTAQETFAITVSEPPPLLLLCSSGDNGGTLVNGVCVLPGASVGQPYEGFILTSDGSVDTFSIVAGSLPPGLSMPSVFGAAGTIVGGTPTQQGTFTFTVHVVNPEGQTAQQTYNIKVDPPPPLTITLPASGSTLAPGTVGSAYAQNFFLSGGQAPYTWSVASGQLPPGLALRSTAAPTDNNNQLSGTPTTAGTFTFTMKVTDTVGDQATQQFSLTIQP